MDYSLLIIFFKKMEHDPNEGMKRNVSMYIKRGDDGHDEIVMEEIPEPHLEKFGIYNANMIFDMPFND